MRKVWLVSYMWIEDCVHHGLYADKVAAEFEKAKLEDEADATNDGRCAFEVTELEVVE